MRAIWQREDLAVYLARSQVMSRVERYRRLRKRRLVVAFARYEDLKDEISGPHLAAERLPNAFLDWKRMADRSRHDLKVVRGGRPCPT